MSTPTNRQTDRDHHVIQWLFFSPRDNESYNMIISHKSKLKKPFIMNMPCECLLVCGHGNLESSNHQMINPNDTQ